MDMPFLSHEVKEQTKKVYSSIRRHRRHEPESTTYRSIKTGCPFQVQLILRYDYWTMNYVDISHDHETEVES